MDIERLDNRKPDAADQTGLPLELRFLRTLLPAETLHKAAADARRSGVTPDHALLASGAITAEAFYRAFARHLGLIFAETPLRPAASATLDDALVGGALPLASNAAGLRLLVAPRGTALAEALQRLPGLVAGLRATVGVTTPDRLEALIRQHRKGAVVYQASHGLADWNEALSARSSPSRRVAMAVLALLVLGFGASVGVPWVVDAVGIAASALFLATIVLRLAATAASPAPRTEALPRRADSDLPLYTTVVPLFRESRVIEALVAALDRLDYPPSRLDIILAVEANDPATLAVLERLRLPGRYRVIRAPAGYPQTKPRALNVALQFARGQFLVVFDAEDRPDPDQLRRAYDGFRSDPRIACLQAKLAIDNAGDSWLARVFALEYAALFFVVNPGLAALRLPIPLGGTSNHFRIEALRRVGGWDAWNVTEDIDLGIRLARFGLAVGTLDSVTSEEAPHRPRAWLAQRRRWQKGWIVTLATLLRRPVTLARDLGPAGTLAVTILLGGTVATCLLGPLFAAAITIGLLKGDLGASAVAKPSTVAVSVVILVGGAVSLVWPILLGLRRAGQGRHGWAILLLPPYLVLLSVAAWLALVEVVFSPFTWAKTEHGRAKKRTHPSG